MASRKMATPADRPSEPVPACLVCGSTGATKVPFDSLPGITLFECRQCDVQFFHPVANPGRDWYEETYAIRNVLEISRLEWYHRQFLRSARVPRGRLLDVGCGTGGFLAAAQARGFTVSGLDFDVAAIEAARDRLGIDDVHPWSFDEYTKQRPGDSFDVLTAFEVLEHQEDVRSFLNSCFHLTRPGGYLAISVPYRDRRPRWHAPWDQPPNHLTRWSERALLSELSRAGYATLETRTGGVASKKFMLFRIRFGLMSGRIGAARPAERQTSNRTVAAASLLLRAKTAVFGGAGVVVDRVCTALGATGIYLYVLAQRPHE